MLLTKYACKYKICQWSIVGVCNRESFNRCYSNSSYSFSTLRSMFTFGLKGKEPEEQIPQFFSVGYQNSWGSICVGPESDINLFEGMNTL